MLISMKWQSQLTNSTCNEDVMPLGLLEPRIKPIDLSKWTGKLT